MGSSFEPSVEWGPGACADHSRLGRDKPEIKRGLVGILEWAFATIRKSTRGAASRRRLRSGDGRGTALAASTRGQQGVGLVNDIV
jgi:hypothetical protein